MVSLHYHYVIKLLVYWYQEQRLCVKWDGMTSDTFPVCNGIKQGGILSPKFINIYVDVLSQQLNKVMVGCCMNGKVINHLYYADDLVLLSPSAHGMQKLLSVKNMHQNMEWNLTKIRVSCLTLKDINSKQNLQPRCILMVPLWKRRHRTSIWVTSLTII